MQYNNRYRNNPKNQATLFDQFFADQFSEASSYDIDIDWHNDEDNDIDFNISKVRNLLKLVKPRKASGPDRIHGLVLKNCAFNENQHGFLPSKSCDTQMLYFQESLMLSLEIMILKIMSYILTFLRPLTPLIITFYL